MSFFRRLFSIFGGAEPQPAPRESAPQLLAVAEEHRRAGRIPEAVELLTEATLRAPANVGLHVALGRVLLHAQRYDEAAAAFHNALRLDPENLVAIRQLAEAFLRKGDKVEAIKKLKLYRGLKPGDRDVTELIERLGKELRPTQPVESAEAAAREITTAPVAPPSAPEAPVVSSAPEAPTPSTPLEAPLPPETAPQVAGVPPPAQTAAPQPPEPSAPPVSVPPPAPAVTETLADLYRAQGYAAEAREAYSSLAERESDAARRAALLEKAAAGAARPSTPEARLREFLSRLPARRGTGIDDLAGVLRDLVSRVDGVAAATLTDLEGLPVVSAGRDTDAELEVLVAELTAFWKSVGRIDGELGAGSLETLALSGARGAAVVSSVSADYALILRVEPGAPLGRIRYEAARTASLLGPALG